MLTIASIDGYKEVLKRRLRAIRSLTEALRDSQKPLLSGEVARLQELTVQQQTLCGEIEFLDIELKIAQIEAGEMIDAEIGAIREEMVSAEDGLVKSFKIHAALLRRARRSVNVMINVATSESKAYCSPSSYQSLHLAEE